VNANKPHYGPVGQLRAATQVAAGTSWSPLNVAGTVAKRDLVDNMLE
jgi:hypothetical protein